MIKKVYLIGGISSLALGFIGIALPVLPTVPFILLASFLFARSSPRLHGWLWKHRYFGPVVKQWEENKTMSFQAKIISISVLALSIGISVIFFVQNVLIRFTLIIIAIVVVTFILRIPGKSSPKPANCGDKE